MHEYLGDIMKQVKADVAIIGAGTAGLSAYWAVKSAGLRAVLIEGGPYGTTCARVGCMPSKLLVAAAEVAHAAANTAPFGVHLNGPLRIDGVQVMDRVKRERDRFVGFVLESVESIAENDKVRGYARFMSDTLLQVDDHTQIEAARIVIATGSSPVIPELFKPLGDRVIVNDGLFEWNDLPRRVMVVGSGVVGLELGQALARLGVEVRVAGRGARVGGLSDPEVTASAVAAFQAEFSLLLNTRVLTADRVGERVRLRYCQEGGAEQEEWFDYVLAAAGRRPNIDRLDLQKTSLQRDDKGLPLFDVHSLQSGSSSIFIAGDVNDKLPVLHVAADDGRIAGKNAARFPDVQEVKRRATLMIVFSDPQIAQVGIRFKDLPPLGVVIGEVDFSGQGRSRVMLKNYGKLRVYADRHSGIFMGAEMAGPRAEHIAHLLAWAVQQQLTVPQMLEMPFYHPVIEEGLRTALRHAASQLETHPVVPQPVQVS